MDGMLPFITKNPAFGDMVSGAQGERFFSHRIAGATLVSLCLDLQPKSVAL